MGWGDALSAGWSRATQAGRNAAGAVADGGRWVGGQVVRGAVAAKRAVVNTGKAVARTVTRGAARAVGRGLLDTAAKVQRGGQAVVRGARSVNRVYQDVRRRVGLRPAASPTQPCPDAGKTPDQRIDGHYMSPQGVDRVETLPDGTKKVIYKGCKSSPPNAEGAAKARADAISVQSACCAAKRRAGEPVRDIVYVNGIKTNSSAHCETLNRIAEQTCGRVIGVFNNTNGFLADAAETAQDRLLISRAAQGQRLPSEPGRNPAVTTMTSEIVRGVRSGNPPEIWAHSQGGAVASLSVYQAQNRLALTGTNTNPLAGLKVKSFASAAPQWANGPDYQHFVHVDDLTPTALGLGATSSTDANKAGRNAQVIRFKGEPGPNASYTPARGPNNIAPHPTKYHDINSTYLDVNRSTNGGCP
jgi:hypothetical protein